MYAEISQLVEVEYNRLGSNRKVGIKCGVSEATISLIRRKSKWPDVSDDIWRKVGARLDYRPDSWRIVETRNTRTLHQYFEDAKTKSWWMMVSSPAGSSKTTAAKTYAFLNSHRSVFYLECDEWSRGHFLRKFAQSMGISYNNTDKIYDILDRIIEQLQVRAEHRPLVILDQADKLYEQAFRQLIPLFNGLEDKLGLVIMGVGHIQKKIMSGVAYQKCGYDEIESRCGRKYLSVPGATMKDVKNILTANGIMDKATHGRIWKELEPTRVMYNKQELNVVTDMRRLKRVAQREQLRLKDRKEERELEMQPV